MDGVPISRGSVSLHGLNMVAVVMPPAADLAVHIVYLPVMRFDQLLLIGGELLFDFLCKQFHTPYLIRAPRQRDGGSVAQPDLRLGDAADLRQIHECRAPHAVKTLVELLFKLAQCHFHRHIRSRVNGHIVAEHICISNLINGDSLHLAAGLEMQNPFVFR